MQQHRRVRLLSRPGEDHLYKYEIRTQNGYEKVVYGFQHEVRPDTSSSSVIG